MGRLILVTGGARSGKSAFALRRAEECARPKIFVATCVPQDREMRRRVALHRRARPASWRTVEAGSRLAETLLRLVRRDAVILVDCLTLFVASLRVEGKSSAFIQQAVRRCIHTIRRGCATVIVVTNEVGMGIVPENALARSFRDSAGFANQRMAEAADEVYCMISGIALRIKGGS